jgi:hypothetical protein
MGWYFIPMVISIVGTMIISYLTGNDTVGDVLIAPLFNIFAYVPLANMAMASFVVIVIFAILLSKIIDVKIH